MDERPDALNPSDPTKSETTTQILSASQESSAKNIFQRRVTILFAATFAAFSFTTWLLTRTQISSNESHDASTPEGVIRMQLDALAQGELQIAYAQFSPQYREEVPYAAFQQIVTMHNQMFRANTIAIEEIAKTSSRDEMRIRITSADGRHYVARYATILIEGRWWIDAMRWRPDESAPERIFTRAMGADRDASVTSNARSIDTARRAA